MSVLLKWRAGTGAQAYELWRNTSATMTGATKIADVTGNTHLDATTTPGVSYWYALKSVNSTGTSGFSALIGPLNGGAALPAPTGVAATLHDANSITVSWSAVAGAANYKVYRHTTENFAGATEIATTGGLSYPAASLGADAPEYFWVVALTAGGAASAPSLCAIGFAARAAPGAFTMAADGFGGFIEVTWTASAQAQHYRIKRDGTIIATVAAPALLYSDESIDPHVVYDYEVIALNYTGSISGGTDTAEADDPVPLAPTGVAASDGTHPGKVVITATPATYATSYELYRAATAFGTRTLIDTQPTPDFEDLVASGTTWWYSMKAVGESGTSFLSNEDSGYAGGLPAPTGVAATDTDTDKVRISWDASAGATSYRVTREGSDIATGITALFYDYDPGAGDTASYAVIATNGAEDSGPSTADSGTRPRIPAPTGVTAGASSTAHITVSWNAVSGATNYDLYRDDVLIAGNLTALTYDDTGATACVAHSYHLVARRIVSGVSDNTSLASAADTGLRLPADWLCAGGGVSGSGGDAGLDQSWNHCGGDFSVYFNANAQKDRLKVYYAGLLVWDTGCIAGEVTQDFFPLPGTTSSVRLEVIPNCEGGSGTAWSFAVTCS